MNQDNTHTVDTHIGSQVSATWAASDAVSRADSLSRALMRQDRAFEDALGEIKKIKDIIGTPENILGSNKTKHGEIAEYVHVGIRRARDYVQQKPLSCTFENVHRTGPIDYIENGQNIQSKFYNGLENTLKGVLNHNDKNSSFSKDGAYHIPKDQWEQCQKILNNENIEGLSENKIQRIRALLDDVKKTSGKSAGDILKPAEATYPEVQKGRVHETLKDRKNIIKEKNDEMVADAYSDNSISWSGAATSVGLGAAAGGGVSFVQGIWSKYQNGRNIFKGELTVEDWRDLGLNISKGAGIGAVSGGAIYCLTNSTSLAAPFAGALVGCLTGIGNLSADYKSGKIDQIQFIECSHFMAAEASIVGLSTFAGQVIIPVPMLGAFIGSCTGKLVTSFVKSEFGKSESELISKLQPYELESIQKLDNALQIVIDDLDCYFGQMTNFMELAFDETLNIQLRAQTSVQIAEYLNVQDNEILRSTTELDAFMEA